MTSYKTMNRTNFISKILIVLTMATALGLVPTLKAEESQTHRVPQFQNDDVEVWKTTIFPTSPLKMHRHENDRIVVPLSDTKLKVVNDKGETKTYDWKAGSAYFLKRDIPGEQHMDVNETGKPVDVMVIQFKNKGSDDALKGR